MKPALPEDMKEIIRYVVGRYGQMPLFRLSVLSHSLPAWRYNEHGEVICVPELAIEDDDRYFVFLDLVSALEDTEEEIEPSYYEGIYRELQRKVI